MFETAYLHPMVVHFPIALIIAGILADTLFIFYKQASWLSKAGFSLMILGTLGACVAFLTGTLFTSEPTEGVIVNIFETHHTWAHLTLTVMIAVSLLRIYAVIKHREERLRWIIYGLFLIGAVAVSTAAFFGGKMVYSYMLGI